MSSKTEQPTCLRATGRANVSFDEFKALLSVLVLIAAFLLIIPHAGASGIPSQVIVFTDKNVYNDFVMQQGRGSGGIPAYVALETDDLIIYSYAIVLDDDGNIMKGLTGINGTLDDTRRLDHYHKNDGTYHHNTTLNPNFYNNINLIYNDTGTFGDGIAGDGIYTAYANIPDADTAQANEILDDHLVINISARYGSRTSYTEVLYSGVACHNGQQESHGTHTSSDVTPTSNGPSPCTICHRGYEHFFENKSSDQNGNPTFPNSRLDVHFQKIQPNYTVRGGNQALTIIWNLSKTGGTAWGGRGAQWETNMPGSSYCYVCHYATAGGTLLDYGAGDRTNLADRPSCSAAGKSLNGVDEAIACHAVTKIEGESTLNWTDPAAGAGTSLNATWKAKSHNQTNPPNKANVSCAICHGNIHRFKLPNSSTTGEDYLDVNNQCILCHNISGGLNITANGGKNANHSNPNCKACHLNNNLKLDAHFMPSAKYPNANCTECHDLGGRALYHIDFDIFNNSDYVHNQYNVSKGLRPLNFNASNGSALRPSENKICWGCHGDDPNNDGKANYSEQPVNDHPKKYKNARRCEECHQNESAPWGAPQNVAHSFNTIEVRTPGAPDCYDCHGQPVMFNNSHKDADFNESNEKGVKASVANHYGTGFPPLAKSRGSNGYCIKYCHQNTSSPFLLEFYNKDNMQRPNHSAMTTRPQNQSCRDKECHAADAIHDEKMRKPTLSGGTFGNGNCTAPGCHSPSDSGDFNYSYHNNVVNCTSCHMDNIGSNIHPIKYLQNDGTDFAQVIFTAANCKLCHKNSEANDTLSRWGVTPKKIGSQHHSGDPENGSKWNKTIQPYWDYVPNQITFVSGWVKNSYRGFIANFDAMKDTNYSAARISENTTEDSFVGHYPSNNDFNVTVQKGGWYSSGTATTRSWSDLPADGNPNGSLIVASTTRSQVVDAYWTAAFVYGKTGRVAYASIKLDSRLVKGKSIDTTMLKAINVTIDDNNGNITEIFNRSLPDVPEVDWSVDERSIPNPESVFWKNGTLDHTYNVTIRTRWTNINGVRSPDIKVAYDNVFVNVSEADYKKYNIILYINNTPPSDRYDLVIGYQTHVEPSRLYVLNGSGFQYRANLDSGAFTKAIIPLSKEDYGNGNVTLRINDSNGPGETQLDVNEIDVKPDYIDIEYMFIDSYRWINNSRLNYPCEYCHAPNKHFQHALGVPYEFMGDNRVGQDVNSSTTWCASCHYKGYSSGGKNYTDMVKAFLDHLLPVPPEISGDLQYGVNKSQSPDYFEHSGLDSFDDSICWNCHGRKLPDGSSSTEFMHDVSAGTSGGSNCTACHDINSPGAVPKVDFAVINISVHGSLNILAVSTEQNKTNKPCWACHGTQAGAYANESDQSSGDHNQTYYRDPRKCEDCHINGSIRFNAPGLTEHIMPGRNTSTQVNVAEGYCSVCHNNSLIPNADTDGMGISGAINASAAHYAKDANNNLMTSTTHSDNCTYCHFFKNGSSEWLTPRKPVTSSHSSLSNDTPPATCWDCHMDSPGEPLTFHVQDVNKGKGSGPDCRSCHNISNTDPNRGHIDIGAFNASIHGSMNTTAGTDDNEPCWGCHGSGNSEGHNTTGDAYGKGSYKNPYNCTDCHISGGIRYAWASSRNALTAAEHFAGGTDIKASYEAKIVFSCLACHQNIGEMKLSNSDIDTNMTVWTSGGDTFAEIGGNASPYHYGKKRADIRSGGNASCSYCHQNSSSVFPLANANKSIREHTDAAANITARACTDALCHDTGYIHNSSLRKPVVNSFTSGKYDYCAPCHKVNDPNATAYIFAHNTTNISIVNMDCGYCHNASSQGQVSAGALKLHTSTLTNTSTRNSSCTSCHRDSMYVGSSRMINTHYPGAQSGKANTSRSGWDCEECHGWSAGTKMHSQGLLKKPDYDCNACHNAVGASPNKAYATPFVNLTRHDNTTHNGGNINCSSCHNSTGRKEPFHFTPWSNGTVEAPGWAGWTNGTRANCIDCHVTYANVAPFYAEPSSWHKATYGGTLNDCYQCHSNLTVLNAGDSRSPVEMHNVTRSVGWNNCNTCHANRYGGAGRVDNTSLESGMHARIGGASAGNIDPACRACHGGSASFHRNTSANDCTYCHITGKTQYNAKNVSEHIPNGNYPGTSVNTSRYQQVSCDLCHNNSIKGFSDDTPGSRNATSAHYGQNKSAGKLMSMSANSSDCLYCHKNTSNMEKWGVSAISRANIINREDHSDISTNAECYVCHVETRVRPQTFHADELITGSGSSPNCLGCHNITSAFMKIDFSVTNHSSSTHKNLNSNASATGYDSANKPCWACHGNGSATAHINDTYKAPRLCESCHINTSKPYGAPQVGEHYRNGSDIRATNATNNTKSCLVCHQGISEMLLPNSDPDSGTFDADGDGINGTGTSAYHYSKKRVDLRSGANTSCNYCHSNSSTPFPLSDSNRSITEHTEKGAGNTTGGSCTQGKCHSSGLIHDTNLSKITVTNWTPGGRDFCAPCHKPGNASATRYVYNQKHDPANSSNDRINDCGFCHNASSQGLNGGTLRIHSETLTNSTADSGHGTCVGCHNGTVLYVGASKQIFSHLPNASNYRGNTSISNYSCEKCHNMITGSSMHSAGMDRSNGTCVTCHFNLTSPFNATVRKIRTWDYNHTYAGQKSCSIIQCHNASGAAPGFHLDRYAGGMVADPEKADGIWGDRNSPGNGFTDTPYVDCIDCHREHGNTYPFNNTYPFDYSTNYSFSYEANHTGSNKKIHSTSDSMDSCYNCHTDISDIKDPRNRYKVHNVTIEPLLGGPACTGCHNKSAPITPGYPPLTRKINHTAFNLSVHNKLANYTLWNESKKQNSVPLDTACWTCHSTNLSDLPNNAHPDRGGPASLRPFQCVECHPSGGNMSMNNMQIYLKAPKIYQHYAGKSFIGDKIFNASKGCQECHMNSQVTTINVSYDETYARGGEANASHYSTRGNLIKTNLTRSGCNQCHAVGDSGGLDGIDYGYAISVPTGHNRMGSTEVACQNSCHNSNPAISITNHNINMGIYLGQSSCYSAGCHLPPPCEECTR